MTSLRPHLPTTSPSSQVSHAQQGPRAPGEVGAQCRGTRGSINQFCAIRCWQLPRPDWPGMLTTDLPQLIREAIINVTPGPAAVVLTTQLPPCVTGRPQPFSPRLLLPAPQGPPALVSETRIGWGCSCPSAGAVWDHSSPSRGKKKHCHAPGQQQTPLTPGYRSPCRCAQLGFKRTAGCAAAARPRFAYPL